MLMMKCVNKCNTRELPLSSNMLGSLEQQKTKTPVQAGRIFFLLQLLLLSIGLPIGTMAEERLQNVLPALHDAPLSVTVKQSEAVTGKSETDPVVELPKITVQEGLGFRYSFAERLGEKLLVKPTVFAATMEDGSPLLSWLVLDAVAGTLSGRPVYDDASICRVKVTATDRTGKSRSALCTVEIVSSAFTLQTFLGKVIEKNNDIQGQKLEWQASEKLVSSARGVFEPAFRVSVTREANRFQNTADEYVEQFPISEYSEINNLWNVSLEGLTSYGGSYRVGYEMKKLQNSIQEEAYLVSNYIGGQEYVTFVGVDLTQPLLKGAGSQVANTKILIAQANADIAYEEYRKSVVETVARSIRIYWDCYGAQEKLKMMRRSLAIADDMLKENRSQYDAGQTDHTVVLDAEVGVQLRRARVAAAEQTELTAKRDLLSLFGVYNAVLNPIFIRVTDLPKCLPVSADYEKSLIHAYETYPQYRSALTAVEREGVKVANADNQRLPQLDFKGRYGFNGLDNASSSSMSKAIKGEYPSWSVGLEFSVPLFGDVKNRDEYHAARLRKLKGVKHLDDERVLLINEMEISASMISKGFAQVQHYEKAVALTDLLFKEEMDRFRSGKSDIRRMLEREEDALRVRESLLDSRIAYQYAQAKLYTLEGSLLQHYGLSPLTKSLADKP